MHQNHLNRAVARATGESLATIRSRGFSLACPDVPGDPEPCPLPNVIDWDELDAQRVSYFPQRQAGTAAA